MRKKLRKKPKQRPLRFESEATEHSKQTHTIELSVTKKTGGVYLSVTGPTSAIGTPLTRPLAAKMRKWLEKYFEVGCGEEAR